MRVIAHARRSSVGVLMTPITTAPPLRIDGRALGRRTSEPGHEPPRHDPAARLLCVFAAVHVIGTSRAGGAVRARLAQRGLRVTDGRDANPAAELVLLCVPDR